MTIGQIVMLVFCILQLIVTALQGKEIYKVFYITGSNKSMFYFYIVGTFLIVIIISVMSIGIINKHFLDMIFEPKLPKDF